MKRITGVGIMVCMLLHYLLPVYAAGSIQTESKRFLNFVHEHPQGRILEIQGDMIINTGIITSREITAYINGYQVRIEHNIDGDSNANIDNFSNDAAWGFVDRGKTPTIEDSRKDRPLVYINTGISVLGLRIHSIEGTALEIAGGEELCAEYTDKKNYTSAEGESTIGVLSKNPYQEYCCSAGMADADIYTNGDNSISVLADWFQAGYSCIEVNGTGLKVIQISDGCHVGNEVIIVGNSRPLEKAWRLDTPMPAEEIAALQSYMVDDLPSPKQVEVTTVSETGEEESFQISLQYDTTAYECGIQICKPFYLCGIMGKDSRERIDIIKHALPFYIIPDSEPMSDMSLCMIRNDTDYYFYFPRAYSAKTIHLYTSTDKARWKFQHNSIRSMSQYAPGNTVLPPYIVVYMLQVAEPFTYVRAEIIGGYYDRRSYVLKVHDAAGDPISDAFDQNKNGGGGEGNDGQGGGRGESSYVSDTPNDKDETILWTIGRDASQTSEVVKKEQRKKEKVIRVEKHEGKPDAMQTTAQANYADTEQLYTGKNKNIGSSQIRQSQSAILQESPTLNPAVLKDMITGRQYETISRSGNIIGEVWENSVPFLWILRRLFQ